MFSRSAGPTEVPPSTTERRGSPSARPGQAGDAASDHSSCQPLSALAYAARRHAGQRRESDSGPFIKHLSAVARLLRDAGCADVVIAAGLPHRVVQDTDVSASALRELADQVRRGRARIAAEAAADQACGRLERYQQMRLAEHHASLSMLPGVAPGHRLVKQLASELDGCPISIRRAGAGQCLHFLFAREARTGPVAVPRRPRRRGRPAVHPGLRPPFKPWVSVGPLLQIAAAS